MSETLLTVRSPSGRPPIILPLIVAFALFMENLNSTVIATALPAMARSLGESPLTMSVAMTSYLINLAIFIPASGWLADRLGGRRLFRSPPSCSSPSASALCAFAPNVPVVLAASRFVQGMGGVMGDSGGTAALVPQHRKETRHLVNAMSWVLVPALLGARSSARRWGGLDRHLFFNWRWIFFLNLPIGLLGIALALRIVPNIRQPDPGKADIRRLVLTGLGTGGPRSGSRQHRPRRLAHLGGGGRRGLRRIFPDALRPPCAQGGAAGDRPEAA